MLGLGHNVPAARRPESIAVDRGLCVIASTVRTHNEQRNRNLEQKLIVAHPHLLSVPKAAERLGVSDSTIKNLFKRGELTRIKIFRRTLIDVREIEALIERLKEASRDN